MVRIRIVALASAGLLAGGCGPQASAPPLDRDSVENEGASATAVTADSPAAMNNDAATSPFVPSPTDAEPANASSAAMTKAPLLGETVVRAQWSKATNRRTCAPLGLKSDAKAGGVPRAATYSGGWAVAFDQPNRRSAYGFAGVGALPEDRADQETKIFQLKSKWPYFRRWTRADDNLPVGSAAGYGLEGFQDYAPGSSGFGQQSVAYLRIPGQQCLYNVWSRLSRDHLELLLSELVVLKP